jgi:putative membrane protein
MEVLWFLLRGDNPGKRKSIVFNIREECPMISKRISSKVLLCVASALMGSTVALAQNTPGGSSPSSGQPGMSGSQPGSPGTANMNNMDPNAANEQSMGDKAFVSKALQGGSEEVQLGQLAEQKSQSDDVKQFAQKMVQDHTQLGDQMKPIAQQLGVQAPKNPSKKDKEMMAKLQELSGPQFDEAYIRAMAKDHKQDLKDFKDEAQMTQNPNLKQVTQQDSGIILQHLQMIEQIAQNHNVALDGKK